MEPARRPVFVPPCPAPRWPSPSRAAPRGLWGLARAAGPALAFALALAPGAGSAVAEVRALLVGVSDYHHLDADLNGPRNDVALMARTLLARGARPEAIRVLTTPGAALEPGLAPAEDPTRATILAGLDRLAAEAGPGDTVVFYYSGHGSQAPDRDGDERGGYDEILLPSDVTGWQGGIGAVENAIVDDELQVKMQAILDSGARLVGVIDACHSATGFRDLVGRGVARYVPPEALGIPEDAPGAAPGAPAPPLSGDFAFLYSSQSDERSFEYPLGDARDPANWYGDFTRNLSAVLTSVPDLSWAQALAAAADGLRREQASQTPDGEGPALQGPVFGSVPVAGRMRVEAGVLGEGLLSGLAEGAEVALYDAAAGGTTLGRARLHEVEATRSRLAAVDASAPLPPLVYAELLNPGQPPLLRIAPLTVADGGDYAQAQAALAAIAAGDLLDGVTWGAADYDLRLAGTGGALALVGRDGVLDADGPGSAPRIAATATPAELLAFLERAVRLERLRTALAAAAGRPGFGGGGLSVAGEVLAAEVAATGCGEAEGPARVLADGIAVADCDQIWLTLANGARRAQDVTVLFVDREMTITPIWPEGDLSNRIAFGERAEVGMQMRADGTSAGIEEIVIIAVPARDGAPRTVLTGLADPAQGRGQASESDTAAWLLAAAGQAFGPEAGSGTASREFRPPDKGAARIEPVRVTRIRVSLSPAAPGG